MHKVSCEGRKPLVWGYLDAQSCWRRKLSKTRGAKVTSLWIWRAQLPLNTRLEAQDLVASMQHFKCSHSYRNHLFIRSSPKTRWGGMGRPRTSREAVTTCSAFSILRTEGTNGWGAFGKGRSLAWISGAPQGKRLCKPGQEPWPEQWDARERLVPRRVDTAGLGEAVRAG